MLAPVEDTLPTAAGPVVSPAVGSVPGETCSHCLKPPLYGLLSPEALSEQSTTFVSAY